MYIACIVIDKSCTLNGHASFHATALCAWHYGETIAMHNEDHALGSNLVTRNYGVTVTSYVVTDAWSLLPKRSVILLTLAECKKLAHVALETSDIEYSSIIWNPTLPATGTNWKRSNDGPREGSSRHIPDHQCDN